MATPNDPNLPRKPQGQPPAQPAAGKPPAPAPKPAAPGDKPLPGKLVSSKLGFYIRPGKHSMTKDDWKVFLDYADANLKPAKK